MVHLVGQVEFDCDIEALSEEIEKAGYVKVVRCKDCKHYQVFQWYEDEGIYECENLHHKFIWSCDYARPESEFYCAMGERREKDDN